MDSFPFVHQLMLVVTDVLLFPIFGEFAGQTAISSTQITARCGQCSGHNGICNHVSAE